MARKLDEEGLRELEEKMEQIKAKKQQEERKERIRWLIQVGAVFEKYFNIIGEDQAEKVAYGLQQSEKT
ncbi:hypothetical protein [Bacillus massiliglaciei]|uniref:hypothetical protein n=1 Tax=Bacillus massiliglaciei TaxID=1816693 RepID=UPI0018FECF57|nr:hypothetical protein [Bacillus massiliglaciei]